MESEERKAVPLPARCPRVPTPMALVPAGDIAGQRGVLQQLGGRRSLKKNNVI